MPGELLRNSPLKTCPHADQRSVHVSAGAERSSVRRDVSRVRDLRVHTCENQNAYPREVPRCPTLLLRYFEQKVLKTRVKVGFSRKNANFSAISCKNLQFLKESTLFYAILGKKGRKTRVLVGFLQKKCNFCAKTFNFVNSTFYAILAKNEEKRA